MDVAEMLIIGKVKQIIWLPPNCHLALFWYLHHQSKCWPLNDAESEHTSNQTSLELIRAHLYHHIMVDRLSILDFYKSASSAPNIFEVKASTLKFYFGMKPTDTLI